MKKILFLISICLFSSQSFAAEKVTAWKIDNAKSAVEFVATQNSHTINGHFAKFSGVINFNKDNLEGSNVKILVETNSVKASLSEAPNVLRESGWFDVKNFPKAEFKSQKFTKISENKFRCNGILTLKGTKIPTVLDFSFDEYSAKKAVAKGEAMINRLDFKVGKEGENGIKDLVKIKFTITAFN